MASSTRSLLIAQKARAFDRITDLLFPEECPNREWNGEAIELVAERVLSIYPKAAEGDRTPAK
jgi:hypothetical protein